MLFSISALDSEQLDQLISGLATDVPRRGNGRTTDQVECWQMQHLLIALRNQGEISPPILLEKREKPDFLMKSGGRKIGVEATEIVNRDLAKGETLPEANHPDSVIDESLFRLGNEGRPLDQLREDVSQAQLTGHGWPGESVEREFAESIHGRVAQKKVKLQNFNRFSEDWLLIYHNMLSPVLDLEKAMDLTVRKLSTGWNESGFSKVLVHKDNRMLKFDEHGATVLYHW